ncbi:DUF4309 domain-containing protein [Kurthia sibirica]|uniref:DUF4309 domain-containing protein n=1 Tax=Kurthia sibirica TaxID=202750 RepID=A0A2U3AR04_9BACL|nr:DUF4309 domain-containing protein [Kurthia sibirica]PWI26988.1 hypothetical protein DEX24_01460 [Kurthia sibirica]GEK34468.1 hypothetical protein KSI01_20010 [Kurthia sibirica]
MKQLKFLSIVASSMLLLAACGEKEASPTPQENIEETSNGDKKEEAPKKEPVSPQKNDVDDEATADNTQDSQQNDKDTTSTTDSETTTNTKSKEEATSTTEKKATTSTTPSVKVNPIHKDFLQNQLKTAKNGMTEGVPFESGETVLEDVLAQWGEPDTQYSNDTNYIEYKKNGAVQYALAVGRGDRIYDVRTFVSPDNSFKLSDMTFDEIKTVLGKPTSITQTGSDTVLNYTTGKNTLKFVGSSTTKKLHHISIFNKASSEPMGGRN